MAMFAEYQPRVRDAGRHAVSGLVIEDARPGDVEGVARLLGEREGVDASIATERASRTVHQLSESNRLLVGRVSGDVVGYGRIVHVDERSHEGIDADVPRGWYLMGVIVTPAFRRRGIARELTAARMRWVAERANEVFYFANSLNRATMDLHREFGFEEVRRGFRFPGSTFSGGGEGVLFCARIQPGGRDK